jgi:hypothetical protein
MLAYVSKGTVEVSFTHLLFLENGINCDKILGFFFTCMFSSLVLGLQPHPLKRER